MRIPSPDLHIQGPQATRSYAKEWISRLLTLGRQSQASGCERPLAADDSIRCRQTDSPLRDARRDSWVGISLAAFLDPNLEDQQAIEFKDARLNYWSARWRMTAFAPRASLDFAGRAGLLQKALHSLAPSMKRRSAGRRAAQILFAAAVAMALLFIILVFVLTSGRPAVDEGLPPTAKQVGAGRDAFLQLKSGRDGPDGRSTLQFGPAQLDGMSAMATHGFRPDRLRMEVDQGTLSVAGSHRLPGGRWLNIGIVAQGHSAGFPPVSLTIGSLSLGGSLSRWVFEIGRQALRFRHADVPPLDQLVRDVAISDDQVAAVIRLPRKSGLVDQMAGLSTTSVDEALVAKIYCRLASAQQLQPLSELTDHLHRAFTTSDANAGTPEYNRATFVALAMLLVDERAGDLAGAARADTASCRARSKRVAGVPIATIWGRSDWPMHWALSAGLAAGAGTHLAEAMGEWKELADSLSKQSEFAIGDPTGFSFADLAADRSGHQVAQAAVRPETAAALAGRLRNVTAEELLPKDLTAREDGISNAEFVSRYGGLADPRFHARVTQIDATLRQAGLLRAP